MQAKDRLGKAKIACGETGIEIKRSTCDLCTGPYCGLNAYVKDGIVIKVEGIDGYPGSEGKLCTKGAANRNQMYRPDRIKTPLRRNGPRGSGEFKPISWDEAYREIARRLNQIKSESGANSVLFFSGYTKWYRFWLERLAFSFGSRNFASDNSVCSWSTQIAWRVIAGNRFKADLKNTKLYLGWGCDTLLSRFGHGRNLLSAKKRGVKIIIIDPRVTDTVVKAADLHLQIKPGTDGALALGMANLLIQNNWYDRDYVENHVHGFEAYKACAAQFTLARTAEITGVSPEKIFEATRLYAENSPACAYFPSAAVTHRTNGFNSMRAMIALQALLGNIDRRGGEVPMYEGYLYTDTGYDTMQYPFIEDVWPKEGQPAAGTERFPLWGKMTMEAQSVALPRQILEKKPYPIRAALLFGMNIRMFPDSNHMLEALNSLEFVVADDLFMTDACMNADLVLPACSSLERSELRGYGGGWITCTEPAVKPLYESKPDTEIICDLANYLDLDDELLRSGYENTMRYMIRNLPYTLEELRDAPMPLKVPNLRHYVPGTMLREGFPTPTGKIELYSEVIAPMQKENTLLDPLPVYRDPYDGASEEKYPLTLVIGARIPYGIHSRMHGSSWMRHMRPHPIVELHAADAHRRKIAQGDLVEISTTNGTIRMTAHLTRLIREGDVYMFHGYPEANANQLVAEDHLDPYTGFPGYRQIRCEVKRAER